MLDKIKEETQGVAVVPKHCALKELFVLVRIALKCAVFRSKSIVVPLKTR